MVQKHLEVLSTRFVITSSKAWWPLLKRVYDKLNKLDITTAITDDRQDTSFEFFWQFICKGLLIFFFFKMYIHAFVYSWFVYYLCTVLLASRDLITYMFARMVLISCHQAVAWKNPLPLSILLSRNISFLVNLKLLGIFSKNWCDYYYI